MQTAFQQQLFVETACPLCGEAGYRIQRASRYPENLTVEQLKAIYRASSDTHLIDQLVQCNKCSLVYVNPRLDEKTLIEGYENTVDEKFIEQNPERIKTFFRLLKSISNKIGLPNGGAGKKILDVGCAGGAFLVAARDFGFDAYGIEPSRWLAESGRQQYGLNIRQQILTPGVFPPASFDVVSLWDVIEHVTEPGALLQTIHGILRPGGYLLVNYPDYGSVAARTLGEKWPFLLSVHLLYYTRETIRKQLELAGFQVSQIQPHWQSLRLGYILERMTPYVGAARFAGRAVSALGAANLPIRYNMGQTLVVARKSP